MTPIKDTAYRLLNPEPKPKELAEHFTPSADEIIWARALNAAPRIIAALVLLKVTQRLGYVPMLAQVPLGILKHVGHAVFPQRAISLRDVVAPDTGQARDRLVKRLRTRLDVRPLPSTKDSWLERIADQAAETRIHTADIINILIEELLHHRYELPAFSRLDIIAKRARDASDARNYAAISALVSQAGKKRIDQLFKRAPGETQSGWDALKREPRQPTTKVIRDYLHHIRMIEELSDQLPEVTLPMPKLDIYRGLARAQDAAEMKEMKDNKRYALTVIFVHAQLARALDNAAQMFIRLLGRMEYNAGRKLQEYQIKSAEKMDHLVGCLRDAALAITSKGNATRKLQAVKDTLTPSVESILDECEAYLAYSGRNYLPFLLEAYPGKRSVLLNCLDIAQPKSTHKDDLTERLVHTVISLRTEKAEFLDPEFLGLDPGTDFNWVRQHWRRYVIQRPLINGQREVRIHRKYFELAVLTEVRKELQSGDLYVERGEKYDDYREHLVDTDTYTEELPEFGEVSGLEIEPDKLIDKLRKELSELARSVDATFPQNEHAWIANGQLHLSRIRAQEVTEAVRQLDALITEKMPEISIIDPLVEVESWLDLHRHFKPKSGATPRIAERRKRCISTLFCYGCNLGPTQTSRSLKDVTRKQVAWFDVKHVSIDAIEQAQVKVINAYNQLDLPTFWGTGKKVSADGTKWDLWEQSLLSEYHIRYGGYGGIGYYHVSDKYVALFSRFIACGVHEGIHILDDMISNEADIDPDTVSGDTHAQSYPVFALSYLLGITLMPRIRGIKDLRFHRPGKGASYENLNPLFSEPINWELIKRHFHDMMRVAVSIKKGTIAPSDILRRMMTRSRKNKLYFAFRELGYAVRTIFLLKYIDSLELRQQVHASTNVSEQFNGFLKWSCFGGQGVIKEDSQEDQQKIIKYGHLVVNMICLHNAHQMTGIIQSLRQEGHRIDGDVLKGLSPYRNNHINRYGDYELDVSRAIEPPEFDRKVIG